MTTVSAALVILPSSTTAILLSDLLWSQLLESSHLPDSTTTLTIAVASLHPSRHHSHPASLVCTAERADPKAFPEDTTSIIYFPRAFLRSHSHILGQPRPLSEPVVPSLVISLTQPLVLSSVILLSISITAYRLALQQDHSEEAFDSKLARNGTVVRTGGVIAFVRGGATMEWKVMMTEPVLQGIVEVGVTKFIVLPPVRGPSQSLVLTNGGSTTNDHDMEGMSENGEEEMEDEEEEFEIDESFLANSVLTPSTALASTLPTSIAPTLLIHPLKYSVTSAQLIPRPASEEEDTNRMYLRAKDLSRLGRFSGDWVVIREEGMEKSEESDRRRRLVRVFAREGVLDEADSLEEDGLIHAYLPPCLHFNLLSLPTPSPASPPSISFQPFRSTSPAFPTAHSITVARVASPHSVHRAYQSLFLEGLKHFFQEKRRLLKKGDLIAVGICEEGARFGNGEPAKVGEEDDEVDFPTSSSEPTAVVYFKITSLDLGPASTPITTLRSKNGTTEEVLNDALEAGEFGCLIDPKVTKMVQTGLEKSLVPDVAGYLNLPDTTLVSIRPTRLGDPTPASRLYDYVLGALRPGANEYDLHLTVLLKGARGCGKRTVVRTVARKTGFHLLELDCFDLLGETELKTEGHLRSRIDRAIACSPCIILLKNLEALARKSQALETGQEPATSTILRECFTLARQGWKISGYPIIVVATTCDIEKIPTGVLGSFKEEIPYEAPGEPERLAILKSLTANDAVAPDVSLRALAIQTAALVAVDLVDLVRRARSSATSRLLDTTISASASTSVSTPPLAIMDSNALVLPPAPSRIRIEDLQHAGMTLTSHDFNAALEKARSSYSESIGAPKIPNVTWDDVGGLANVKSDILDTIQLPLEHPELFADGLKKRSGILLYGPPGTGKTLLAKAVATSCSLNFFSIKGPELLNMYIGESEANVRRVFQRARDAKPCVIFFDELDSVAPKRGNQGDSGGVMDRIVSQLLAELDGMSEGKGGSDVFVIGATNRPDLLDPALLRPGRFDRMLYLGVSDNHDSQLKIIQALTRKFKLDPDIRLEDVARICPFNYTGADFYALCSDAMLKAMTRVAEAVDAKIALLNLSPPYSTSTALTPQYYLAELALPAELDVLVSQVDFELALAELVPSVSQAEMLHYKIIQSRFSGETMNSDENLEKKEAMNGHANGNGNGNGEVLRAIEEKPKEEEDVVVVNGDRKGKGKARAVNQEE